LAKEQNALAEWLEILNFLTSLLRDKQITNELYNLQYSKLQFANVLIKICEANPLLTAKLPAVLKLVGLLVKKQRVDVLPEIAAHYCQLMLHAENTVEVSVTVARPISAEQGKRLASALEKRLAARVILKYAIDKTILGGMIVNCGGKVIDGSVRGKLQCFTNVLT